LVFHLTAREVNSRLQSWGYIGRWGFMPRFCGFSLLRAR